MTDFVRNKWMPAGKTVGGWENIPMDGTPFLVMHPQWVCPAVCGFSYVSGKVIFIDPDLHADAELDYIVDFTDMLIYIYEEPPK